MTHCVKSLTKVNINVTRVVTIALSILSTILNISARKVEWFFLKPNWLSLRKLSLLKSAVVEYKNRCKIVRDAPDMGLEPMTLRLKV